MSAMMINDVDYCVSNVWLRFRRRAIRESGGKDAVKLFNIIVGAMSLLFWAYVPEAKADFVTTLVTFTNSNGASPYGGLSLGSDGNLYGTTSSGGPSSAGSIFELDSNEVFTTLAFFAYTNGSFPPNAMTVGTNGNFYGVTYGGGAHGLGTVFEFVPATRTIIVLHSFDGTNGCNPWASLCLASNGVFYGTTAAGGVAFQGYFGSGYGTLFSITHQGGFSILHAFTNGTDGSVPYGKLVQGTNGNLFGTAYYGGSYGDGTIFEWDLDPGINPLAQFYGANGSNPTGGLTLGCDGYLYGVTSYGGSMIASGISDGEIFRVDYAGNLQALRALNENNWDGGVPYNGLFSRNGREFYFTTYEGGMNGWGTLSRFSIGANSTVNFQTIYNLRGLIDGGNPDSSPAADRFGNIYVPTTGGQTVAGGTANGSLDFLVTFPTLRLHLMPAGTLQLKSEDLQVKVTYQFEYKLTLPGNWENWGSSFAPTGRTYSVTSPISSGSGFWRLKGTPPGYF